MRAVAEDEAGVLRLLFVFGSVCRRSLVMLTIHPTGSNRQCVYRSISYLVRVRHVPVLAPRAQLYLFFARGARLGEGEAEVVGPVVMQQLLEAPVVLVVQVLCFVCVCVKSFWGVSEPSVVLGDLPTHTHDNPVPADPRGRCRGGGRA